jgi:hypothetical protein
MPQNDQALLKRLKDSGLEFVVVGGVSAVFHGAPIATFDLDICCSFGEQNIVRIESAVKDLHPFHRLTANKLPLEMTRAAFSSFKNLYLQTDLGKLDCLGEIIGVGNFEAVREHSIIGRLSYGEFRILNIDALIASKSAVGRDKDMEAVRLLRAIKEKNERQKNLFE